jgi:aromatic-L-amino-acid decarboxylase
MQRLNAEGRAFLTHTRLRDRLTLRFSVGQYRTGSQEVAAAWQRIVEVAREAAAD